MLKEKIYTINNWYTKYKDNKKYKKWLKELVDNHKKYWATWGLILQRIYEDFILNNKNFICEINWYDDFPIEEITFKFSEKI